MVIWRKGCSQWISGQGMACFFFCYCIFCQCDQFGGEFWVSTSIQAKIFCFKLVKQLLQTWINMSYRRWGFWVFCRHHCCIHCNDALESKLQRVVYCFCWCCCCCFLLALFILLFHSSGSLLVFLHHQHAIRSLTNGGGATIQRRLWGSH